MKTIRIKLFLIFSIFMVAFILCGVLMNALFLERYYIYKNKGIFIDTYKNLENIYKSNAGNLDEYIKIIDQVDGISTTIADANLYVTRSSAPLKSDTGLQKLPSEIEQMVKENENVLGKSYVYSIVVRPDYQEREIVFLSMPDNKTIIAMKKPMKGVSESVSIANQFYVYAGLLMVIVGGIFIFMFSTKATRPIIEMSAVAEDISNLEFSKRVTYSSKDEIGILGRSMNKISEKLSTSINELKQDVDRRKQLVRNISHELKTPIGVIKGYAEGLKYGVAEDKEKAEKYCTVIAEECNRMDNMVRELLNLSLLESGMFQPKISQFDAGKSVQGILERFEPIFTERGITLDLDIGMDLKIYADCELFERAVNNYITNAIHHTDGSKYIKVTAENKDDFLRVSVFNTGKHIKDNDMEHIWDVFYKADKARSRQYGGHGLGLSIVRQVAEVHGGSSGVQNVNDGVLFFIHIPQISKEEK
jgi:two-component system sensor histidine kinase VanS